MTIGTTRPGWLSLARVVSGKLSTPLKGSISNRLDPWPKFYGLQVLVSAYAHLGRSDRVAAYRDRLKEVMLERNDIGANQLLTQKYFVFKNRADVERLLDGLSKAGVPELPEGDDLDTKERLTGAEIRSLIVGHKLNGEGAWLGKETTWVQGNFLCDAFPKTQTTCGAVFRNPTGTPEQKNELPPFSTLIVLSFRSSNETN